MKIKFIKLNTTNPAFNLAAEEYVFNTLPKDYSYLMLWQNDNAIIIGKYQNTLSEINQEYVKEHNIKVVRRLSGGGTVYHDLGNLNYTMILDAGNLENLDIHLFCQPVIKTLNELGIPAQLNGRNDMTLDGKKFSGNSQYIKNGRVMHHGTLMFNSNLDVITKALNVDKTKIESKGIKSVRSRVTNIGNISMEEFTNKLLSNYDYEEYKLTDKDIAEIKKIKESRYDTYEWNYGFSPKCTILKEKRIEGVGKIEAYIYVEKGSITNLEFKGDFFSKTDPSELAQKFIGLKPEPEEYNKVLDTVDVSKYFVNLTKNELLDILKVL